MPQSFKPDSKPPSLSQAKKATKDGLAQLFAIKNMLPNAWARAEVDRQDGFPNRNGERSETRTSEITDTTSALALGPHDEIDVAQREVMAQLHIANKALHTAKTKCIALVGLPHNQAQNIAEDLNRKTRDCIHCGDVVMKLVSGRCDTCFKYWRTHEGTDRPLREATR